MCQPKTCFIYTLQSLEIRKVQNEEQPALDWPAGWWLGLHRKSLAERCKVAINWLVLLRSLIEVLPLLYVQPPQTLTKAPLCCLAFCTLSVRGWWWSAEHRCQTAPVPRRHTQHFRFWGVWALTMSFWKYWPSHQIFLFLRCLLPSEYKPPQQEK